MRSRYYPPDKKISVQSEFIQNISFDLSQYCMPSTALHRDHRKIFQQSEILKNDSASPRKKDRVSRNIQYNQQKVNLSLNIATQNSQTSKRLGQQQNLTDKSGSSIDVVKELIAKPNQTQIRQQHFHTQNIQTKIEKHNQEVQTQHAHTKINDSSAERVAEFKVLKSIQYPQFSHHFGKECKSSSREKPSLLKVYSNLIEKQSSSKNKKELDWCKIKLPLTPTECIEQYGQYLTTFEKEEILQYSRIYYIGYTAKKPQISEFNEGFDDQKGEYLITPNDHIGYRYEILEVIGKGSFGQALKVYDHKKNLISCLKIIRNKKKFYNQALIELNILTYIKDKDIDNITNIVKIKDFLVFRNHVCIIFELLSMNLYELIRLNNFQGLSLELIRRFAIQILNSLNFLYKHNIIHCDLKPENILLKMPNKSGIKIIDFGSSCFEDQRIYTYIQSRYYRAPEVILGIQYDKSIDMWSFGCILAELYLGYPIFPGENEQDQISYVMEALGTPEIDLLQNAQRRKVFFKDQPPFKPLLYQNKRGKVRLPGTKDLKTIMKCNDNMFVDFISKCLVWNPKKRIKPIDALMHMFILEGLPSSIREQHIQYLESEQLTQGRTQKSQMQGQQGKQVKHNYISEPEMNQENRQVTQVQIKQSQIRSQSKEKELFGTNQTPVNKKISSSVHSSKNANQKQNTFLNYFPGTSKNIKSKKNQYFF